MKFCALILISLLTGCVVGTREDAAFMAKAFFDAGYNCHKYFPERTFDECWAKYSDIVK
jgi:hypothetical protein